MDAGAGQFGPGLGAPRGRSRLEEEFAAHTPGEHLDDDLEEDEAEESDEEEWEEDDDGDEGFGSAPVRRGSAAWDDDAEEIIPYTPYETGLGDYPLAEEEEEDGEGDIDEADHVLGMLTPEEEEAALTVARARTDNGTQLLLSDVAAGHAVEPFAASGRPPAPPPELHDMDPAYSADFYPFPNPVDPPVHRPEYRRLKNLVAKVMEKYPDGIVLDSLCLEVDLLTTRAMKKRRIYMGYRTWADFVRSMPDLLRVEGSRHVGYTVYSLVQPKPVKPPVVVDPDHPPWWWQPPQPEYLVAGPRRRKGTKEYMAFRNIVRITIEKYPQGISWSLFLSERGLQGKKAKINRIRTGYRRLGDLVKSMPDLLDMTPNDRWGLVLKPADPNKPPPPPPRPPPPPPPGAPVLPGNDAPKADIYQTFRDILVWNLENLFTPDKFPRGVRLARLIGGYSLSGMRAYNRSITLGYPKMLDLLRTMDDIVSFEQVPAEDGKLVWNATPVSQQREPPFKVIIDPLMVKFPRRFPSDPLRPWDPNDPPPLPAEGSYPGVIKQQLKRIVKWTIDRYPQGLSLPEFYDKAGLRTKQAKEMRKTARIFKTRRFKREMADLVQVVESPTEDDVLIVLPAPPPPPVEDDVDEAYPLPPGWKRKMFPACSGKTYEFDLAWELAKLHGLKEPVKLEPLPGPYGQLKRMVEKGIQKFPKGAPLVAFSNYCGLSSKNARLRRRALGYPKMVHLLRSMPQLVQVKKFPADPSGYKVVPAPGAVKPVDEEGEWVWMSTGVYAYKVPKPVVVEPLEPEWLSEARRQGLCVSPDPAGDRREMEQLQAEADREAEAELRALRAADPEGPRRVAEEAARQAQLEEQRRAAEADTAERRFQPGARRRAEAAAARLLGDREPPPPAEPDGDWEVVEGEEERDANDAAAWEQWSDGGWSSTLAEEAWRQGRQANYGQGWHQASVKDHPSDGWSAAWSPPQEKPEDGESWQKTEFKDQLDDADYHLVTEEDALDPDDFWGQYTRHTAGAAPPPPPPGPGPDGRDGGSSWPTTTTAGEGSGWPTTAAGEGNRWPADPYRPWPERGAQRYCECPCHRRAMSPYQTPPVPLAPTAHPTQDGLHHAARGACAIA